MNPAVKLYLFLFNLSLSVGWAYILYLTHTQRADTSKMWYHVQFPLKIFQTAAILEVLHAATGIVKSNVFLTFFQVLSRVFVLWCVLDISPPSQVCIGVPMLLIAWCITEIIRYGYYFLNIIGMAQIIVYLRYTLFIALYPIGVTGELLCIYASLPYVNNHNIWSIEMPNALNFSFNFYYILVMSMLMYIPIFPQLYLHMFAQRRKIIGGGSSSKKESEAKSK